jgi:hypothetical protein
MEIMAKELIDGIPDRQQSVLCIAEQSMQGWPDQADMDLAGTKVSDEAVSWKTTVAC